jgi:imidazolonepropionase-like amidohydrolase
MIKILTLLPIALCFTAAAQKTSNVTQHEQIYVTHVTVIDTDKGKEVTDQTAVISDRKISDVANSKDVAVPPKARIVDGRGKYLIPGLWDMHVHAVRIERISPMFPMFVATGVLGIRDMGVPIWTWRRWT